MFKVQNKEIAVSVSRDLALWHGWSIFGGEYYIGTEAELRAIGVLDPIYWR